MKKSLWAKIKNFVYPLPEQKSVGYLTEGTSFTGVSSVSSNYWNFDWMPSADLKILGVATALRCIAVIADSIAQTPFNLYINDNRTVKKGIDHPLYKLLTYAPNQWMDVSEFWQMIGLRLALQGEIVLWKVYALGQIQQIIPFPIDRVTIYTDYVNGFEKRTYSLQKDDGSYTDVPSDQIWHLKRMNFWKCSGLAIDSISQVAINMALSESNFMQSFLTQGIKPSGILTAKQSLTPEQYKIVSEAINKANAGAYNAGKLLILSNDFDFKSVNFSNSDAQFVENRDLLISDICRFWGVPPYMAYHYKDNVSYSSSEHATLTFITNTLAPIFRAIEKGAERRLLSYEDYKKGYYFKFNEKALLRMDAKTQAEVIRTKVNTGMYTVNEARALEELPPVEGGDVPLVQGAMIKLTDVGAAYAVPDKQNNNNEGASTSSEQSSEDK